MKIGDRVEAGWESAQEKAAWARGPRGKIIGRDGTHFIVKWENGYTAAFPRVELRLVRGAARRQGARRGQVENLEVLEVQETP